MKGYHKRIFQLVDLELKNSGLEEVINEAPQIAPLAPVEIIRGSTDFEPLNYIKKWKNN